MKKNNFWKILAKIGIFIASTILKNQKGINSLDVDKGTDIANKSIDNI